MAIFRLIREILFVTVAFDHPVQVHLDCSIDNSITIIITIFTTTSMTMTMTMMQLQESEEEKKEEGEEAEKKDDSIVYADLDKSAMSEGNDDVRS